MKKGIKRIISFLFIICMFLMGSMPVNADTVEYTTAPGTDWTVPYGSPPRSLNYIVSVECGHAPETSRFASGRLTFIQSPYNIILTGKIYYVPPYPYTGDWILMKENTKEAYGFYNTSMTFDINAYIPYNPNGTLKYPTGGEWFVEYSWGIRNPDEEIWRTDDVTLWTEYAYTDDTPLHMWNEGYQIIL